MSPELPAVALDYGIRVGLLPPPWFVPLEAPACGDEIHVPTEAIAEGAPPRIVCDRIAGHDGPHRMVTDNEAGYTFEWSDIG